MKINSKIVILAVCLFTIIFGKFVYKKLSLNGHLSDNEINTRFISNCQWLQSFVDDSDKIRRLAKKSRSEQGERGITHLSFLFHTQESPTNMVVISYTPAIVGRLDHSSFSVQAITMHPPDYIRSNAVSISNLDIISRDLINENGSILDQKFNTPPSGELKKKIQEEFNELIHRLQEILSEDTV